MADDNQLSALERLTKLRDSGALSEQEFAAQKATILGGGNAAKVPFYRRLWFVVLLTCLIITFWVALIILATGQVYKRGKDRLLVPISKTSRLIYAGLLALWVIALIIKNIADPHFMANEWAKSASTETSSTQQSPSGKTPPDPCDSSDVAEMVKRAVEDNATSGLVHVKVLDYGNAQESFFDKPDNIRYCRAAAELNTGEHSVSFKLYFGPSGGELIEVKSGSGGYDMEIEAIKFRPEEKAIKAEAEEADARSKAAARERIEQQEHASAPAEQQAAGPGDQQKPATEDQSQQQAAPANGEQRAQ